MTRVTFYKVRLTPCYFQEKEFLMRTALEDCLFFSHKNILFVFLQLFSVVKIENDLNSATS